MATARTTLHLPDDLRHQLRELAARRRTTMSALLIRGAQLVLSRAAAEEDVDELRQRASAARRELRSGMFDGEPVGDVDELLYG